jgi:hypothetical protein
MSPKAAETRLAQSGKTMMFDVVSIKVGKEFLEPLVHDLMVYPSMLQFSQKDRSSLTSLVPEGLKDVCCKVPFDGITVPLIKLARPIVRGSLRTHVVACTKSEKDYME